MAHTNLYQVFSLQAGCVVSLAAWGESARLKEQALLGVHELRLGHADAKTGGVKCVDARQEAAEPGAQLALAVARRLKVPACM